MSAQRICPRVDPDAESLHVAIPEHRVIAIHRRTVDNTFGEGEVLGFVTLENLLGAVFYGPKSKGVPKASEMKPKDTHAMFRFSPNPNSAHRIHWREWGADAFEYAREQQKPVMLYLGAFWCGICQRMDETTFSNTEIIALLNAYFVPVRVEDAQRPDIDVRYNRNGWPTIVFMSAGGDYLAAVNYLAPGDFSDVLVRVHVGYQDSVSAAAPEPPPPPRETPHSGPYQDRAARGHAGSVGARPTAGCSLRAAGRGRRHRRDHLEPRRSRARRLRNGTQVPPLRGQRIPVAALRSHPRRALRQPRPAHPLHDAPEQDP